MAVRYQGGKAVKIGQKPLDPGTFRELDNSYNALIRAMGVSTMVVDSLQQAGMEVNLAKFQKAMGLLREVKDAMYARLADN